MLNKAVTKKLEYEDIEPCFSDISNQINACESIILGHIKKIVEE